MKFNLFFFLSSVLVFLIMLPTTTVRAFSKTLLRRNQNKNWNNKNVFVVGGVVCYQDVSQSMNVIPSVSLFTTNTNNFVSSSSSAARKYQTQRYLSSTSDETTETSLVDRCQQKIQQALNAETVKVTGAYDDPNGSHISIEVVSTLFTGKRPVQRQQLVYKAIWEELQGPVHAVDSMICKTPEEVV